LEQVKIAIFQSTVSVKRCYTITTSHEDLNAEEICNLYMTIVRVEEAFRSLKIYLGLGPVYHQKAKSRENC
jgi:transposase